MCVHEDGVAVGVLIAEIRQRLVEEPAPSVACERVAPVEMRVEDEQGADGLVLPSRVRHRGVVGDTQVTPVPEDARRLLGDGGRRG